MGVISVRLDNDTEARLKREARSQGISFSDFLRKRLTGEQQEPVETAGGESAETVLSALRQIADFLRRMEQAQRESGYFTQRLVFNALACTGTQRNGGKKQNMGLFPQRNEETHGRAGGRILMMSGRAINYEKASTYYEHSADYYNGHQSHYDKWHGKLAKRLKLSGELSKGEFVHFLNRNNELDLHSHCVILNQTDTDGKILALDFDKLLEHQKILGLMYRKELAHELLAAGYELEITNSREGYFELKGFDRETVIAHSTRRQEILAEADRQGAMTAQGKMLANLATRKAKDKSVRYEDVLAEVKQNLYDTGKIKIEYHRNEQEPNGKLGRRDDDRGGIFAGRETGGDNADERNEGNAQHEHLEADAGQSGFADIDEDWSEMPQSLAQGNGLPKLPQFPLDVPAIRSRLLLPIDTIRHLASLQTEKEYHLAMQRAHRRERRRRIDEIAKTAVEHLYREAFAFSIPEVCHRIMAEGVLERISQKEVQAAMERLQLVKLGRLERGKNRKDVYVTTKANIRQEHNIIERMKQGKGIIPKTLSMEQSKELLNRVATGKNLTPNEE